MAVETESRAKRNRTRSPSYPYLDLPTALEKVAVLWNVEGRHAVSVGVAMQHWGYKEESSTGYSCVAALKKFGLVDHDGMGETRQIRLSALTLAILLDRDPASADRRDAVRRAALNPGIHAELWERYGAELPSDQTLRRFLVVERNFNEASVDELLAEYKETVAFAGLLGRGPAAQTGAAPAGVPPVMSVPVPEAPRGPQKPQGRAGDARVALWQDRPDAAAFAAPAAPANVLPPPPPPSAGRWPRTAVPRESSPDRRLRPGGVRWICSASTKTGSTATWPRNSWPRCRDRGPPGPCLRLPPHQKSPPTPPARPGHVPAVNCPCPWTTGSWRGCRTR